MVSDIASTEAKKAKKAEAAYDAELVRKFKLGDESAFTEIFERYYTVIRAVANDTLHNASDAEEVAQDTFMCSSRVGDISWRVVARNLALLHRDQSGA